MERRCLRGLAGILLCLLVTNGCYHPLIIAVAPLAYAYRGLERMTGSSIYDYPYTLAEVD
jgi:hypothetical protein